MPMRWPCLLLNETIARRGAITSWQSTCNWTQQRNATLLERSFDQILWGFCCVRTMTPGESRETKMIFRSVNGYDTAIFKPFRGCGYLVLTLRSASKVDDSFKCLFSLIGIIKICALFRHARISVCAHTTPHLIWFAIIKKIHVMWAS